MAITEYGGDLEARVAALEERLAHPLMAVDAGIPEFSDKQVAELREALEAAGADSSAYRILPPRPLLTPETARELLRECVTVVKPGEVLLIRMPDSWTAGQAHEAQQRIGEIIADRGLDLPVLLLPGEEFAVAKAEAE